MAKLYFKYGCMNSSKTAQLIMTKHNYEEKGMKVFVVKPAIDTRDGEDIIASRVGLKTKVDIILDRTCDNLLNWLFDNNAKLNVILCDEAQFLTTVQVNALHKITKLYNIPVICYGLLTDYKTELFTGSKRLIELAESKQEIKTVCKCGKKAIVNARIKNGKVTIDGEQIELGGNESYESMCYICWEKGIL